MDKSNLFIEDRDTLIRKIRDLIENMKVSRENPDCDLSFDFNDLPCNRDCNMGEEVLMLDVRLSGGHVYKLTPYGEVPLLFMGGLEPFSIDRLSIDALSDIYNYLESDHFPPEVRNYEIPFVNGSIFDIDLQNSLGIDSIVAFVRDGFNPTELKWNDYSQHPNARINNLWLYHYNKGCVHIPDEKRVPGLIFRALDEITGNGARKIGISQLTFKGEDGKEYDNDVADSLLHTSVRRWLDMKGNAAKVDELYLVIDTECKLKKNSCLISCMGNALDHGFIKSKYIQSIFAPIERGFSISKGSLLVYKTNQIPGVQVETHFYDRNPEGELTVSQYEEIITQFLDGALFCGRNRIATYGMHLKGEDGREIGPKETDGIICGILQKWIDSNIDAGITIYYVNQYIPKK